MNKGKSPQMSQSFEQNNNDNINNDPEDEEEDQVEMIMNNSSQIQYQQQLEAKINQQAQRLCEFQQYSILCEKRIKQLCPTHPFPIIQSHLSQAPQIQLKDVEYDKLQKNLFDLQAKYNSLNDEYLKSQKEKKDTFDVLLKQNYMMFPSIERIPSEKIFDAYKKIYDGYKKLFSEKETVIASLKQEIINNDQQRNYIEILKQTIESSLIRTGLKNKIESAMAANGTGMATGSVTQFNFSSGSISNIGTATQEKGLIETVVNLTQLHNEIEKLKGDNTALEVTNAQLQNEMAFSNSNINSFKEKVQETLERGMIELEEAKNKVKSLESDKESLSFQLNEISQYNDHLKVIVKKFEDDNSETNSMVIKMQKSHEEKTKNLNQTITKLLEEQEKMTQLNNELIKNNDMLKEGKKMLIDENVFLKKEKQSSLIENKEMFTTDILKLKGQINQLEKERKNLQTINAELITEIQKVRNELSSSLEALEKLNEELVKESDEKKKIIDDIQSDHKEFEIALTKKDDIIKQLQNQSQLQQQQFINQYAINNNNNTGTYQKQSHSLSPILSHSPSDSTVNVGLDNNTKEELKMMIYKCLNTSNIFLQNCKKIKCDTDYHNSPLIELIDDVKIIADVYDKCYKTLSNKNNSNDSNSNHSSNNKPNTNINEHHRQSYTASSSPDQQRHYESTMINKAQETLLRELKSYKADNKKLYDNNKRLLDENISVFFLSKENKFLNKFIIRIIKYHIQNYDMKNLLNEIMTINDSALNLEIDKTKIENKIAALSKDTSQLTEMNKLKDLIKQIDSQISDKFMQLKQLESELKQFEYHQ